ncbi:hypothetical protein AVDCRST_MAG94-6452 [uncultured Leptolyngbya sp.]|uniref:Uncharacterized protein n=1 Tax=uncultured Leptolyngbya sp. TaxID=332963 RepID=A0A6J4PBA6_9CYAN|nr:hypothetical protein AVDCRST_MAG94-6452 [uncultured Leptolyngbya sp.]
MLYLNPPYQVIDGYTLLPDHTDPGLFYLLPSAPRLANSADARPAFSLVQYLGGDAGNQRIAGGILSLTTELTVPEEVLPRLQERLKAKLSGDAAANIRLVPVLFDAGTVELVALGERSAAAEGSLASAGSFELQILGSGKPSLGGNNVASFQLLLDPNTAELVEKCIELPDMPILVIYRLTFAGLRPSFQVNVQADWRKVYKSLQNRANVNVYFVAADADVLIKDVLEENNIKIDTAVFGTDESARSAAERARKQLIDWVLEHLFTPIVDPAATPNAIGQVIDDTVWSLTRAVIPGVGYRLRVVDDEQLRLLSAQMNEMVAERREVLPQATLGSCLHRYQIDKQGRPIQIDLLH